MVLYKILIAVDPYDDIDPFYYGIMTKICKFYPFSVSNSICGDAIIRLIKETILEDPKKELSYNSISSRYFSKDISRFDIVYEEDVYINEK